MWRASTAQVDDIVRDVKAAYPGVRLGIHCHNDQGLAVANSLQAVRSGADVVQVEAARRWVFPYERNNIARPHGFGGV